MHRSRGLEERKREKWVRERSSRDKLSPEFSWPLCLIVFRISNHFNNHLGSCSNSEGNILVSGQHFNSKLLLKRFHFCFHLTSGETFCLAVLKKLVSWLVELFELNWITRQLLLRKKQRIKNLTNNKEPAVSPNNNCYHENHVRSLSFALGSVIDFMLVYVTGSY